MVCSLFTILKTAILLTPFYSVYNNVILNKTDVVGVEVVYKSQHTPETSFLATHSPVVRECFYSTTPITRSSHPNHTVSPAARKPKRNNRFLYCFKSPRHLRPGSWKGAVKVDAPTRPSVVEGCSNTCRSGYKFFGIDSGAFCWCARRLPRANSLRKEMCLPCYDRADLSCGNVLYGMTSLYQILYSPSPVLLPKEFFPVNSSAPARRSPLHPLKEESSRLEISSRLVSLVNSSVVNHSIVNSSLVNSTLVNNSVVNSTQSALARRSPLHPLKEESSRLEISSRLVSLVNHSQVNSTLVNSSVVNSTQSTRSLVRLWTKWTSPRDETPTQKILEILDYRTSISNKQDRVVKELVKEVMNEKPRGSQMLDNGENQDKDEEED